MREQLWEAGLALAKAMVARNDLPAVKFVRQAVRSGCGLYYPSRIVVDVQRCARPGYGGRAWSWPGYKVDRTPYGVVCHELGHHWHLSGAEPRKLEHEFRLAVRGEEPVTNYAPDTGEEIAESFRLFTTNPSLLAAIRPETHAFLRSRLEPVEARSWREVLAESSRHLRAAENQVLEIGKRTKVQDYKDR